MRGSGTIAVLTYRRPSDLAVVVPQLLDQAAEAQLDFNVLVVDNDPEHSARSMLETLCGPGLRWVVEPRPGIAAARNRALDECADRDLLVFIDDDESPRPGWLASLVAQQAASGATAVAGAVVSEFDGDPDPWIQAGGFFARPRQPSGTRVDLAATNNLLLDMRAVRALGVRFDERFGLTGGSDSLFTRELVSRGGSIVWCDEAIVVDRVPRSRMTRKWVVRRWFRMGNTWSQAALMTTPRARRNRLRARLCGQGIGRVLVGAAQALVGTMTASRRHQATGCRVAARGSGMLLGAFGYRFAEYLRS